MSTEEKISVYEALSYHPVLQDKDVALFGMMRTKLVLQKNRIKELEEIGQKYCDLIVEHQSLEVETNQLSSRITELNEFDRHDILDLGD